VSEVDLRVGVAMNRVAIILVILVVLVSAAGVAAPGSWADNCTGYSGFSITHHQCDSDPYEDGSFDRCLSQRVLGFYTHHCTRIYP